MAIPAAVGENDMEAKKPSGAAHDAKKDRLIDGVRSNAEALRALLLEHGNDREENR